MQWKWTRRMHYLTTAASAGGACWVLAAMIGLGQTTTPSSDTSQTNRTQGSSYSYPSSSSQTRQYGTTQSGSTQSGYGQSSANQYRPGTSGYSNQSRDTNRQSRDSWQDTRNQTRDAIGDARDDMRDTTRQARDQFQNTRDQNRDRWQDTRDQSRDQFRDTRDTSRSQRDDSREATRSQQDEFDEERGQGLRDSSRDNQRDDFRNQGQRDYSRDTDRDDFRNQGQQDRRDLSRDQFSDRNDQFSDRRDQFQSGRRDQFQDNRNLQDRSDQFQSGRSDQFQGGRFDQRSGQAGFQGSSRGMAGAQAPASGQTQISRAADLGLWLNRNTSNGLVVSDIASSGPITQFGFREGDQILSVNGNRVASEQQFLNFLTAPQYLNQRAQVLVWRNGQQVPLWVEPWTLVQHSGAAYVQSDPLQPFGIVLDDRYQSPVVWKVLPQSPAYYAGIRGNDVIVAWNGQHVNDPQELTSAAEQTQQGEIPVQLSRNRQLRNVTLEVDGQTRTALRPGYEQSYDGTQQQGYTQQTQTFQQGYAQPQTFQQGYTQGQTYVQPGATYVQPGTTYVQPQGGTYVQPQGTQQNRPGILPFFRGR